MKSGGYFILLYLVFHLSLSFSLMAQIPVGEWRTHLSYDSIQEVTSSEKSIFAASQSGIMIYNKNYNSTETIDRINGLSEAGISSIGYSENQQALLIGYHNGNLDLLKNGDVTNYPDLKEHTHYIRKNISSITFRQGKALLSCPFGIAVFDITRGEFLETYRPGMGQVLKVYEVAYDQEYYYAATESGLFYADVNAPDLYNPYTWEQVTTFPQPGRKVEHVATFGGYILISVIQPDGENEIYYLDGLSSATLLRTGKVAALESTGENLYAALTKRILVYSRDLELTGKITNYAGYQPSPTSVLQDSDGTLWIGDGRAGLIKNNGNKAESIIPNGPSGDHAFKMVSAGSKVFTVPGGYNKQFQHAHRKGTINKFSQQQWYNNSFPAKNNFVDMVIDPENHEHLFTGTWGHGLLEIRGSEIVAQYQEDNSTLEPNENQGVLVNNLKFDEEGNLWMLNFGATNPVKFRGSQGNWKTFEYEALRDRQPVEWTSVNNYKWGFFHDSPYLFIIDDRETPSDPSDDRVKITEPRDFNGNSYTDRIYAIQADREGNIWFATDEGVGVDYDPGLIFEKDTYQPNRLRITQEGYTHFMLRDNVVMDIAIDPANQIWFATKAAGVFAYNPESQKMIHHFTTSNSPLLTDTLQSITVNDEGEVFMGTSRGVISYRSKTSGCRENFNETYAFPNPVPPDYHGPITITNLVENVNVKVTDINGNLVYETIAKGGQATWNGKNLSGSRVNSGVYLIFLTNEDGSKTHVEKILFIQ